MSMLFTWVRSEWAALFSSSSFIIQVTVAEETHSLRKDIRLVGDPVRGKMMKIKIFFS